MNALQIILLISSAIILSSCRSLPDVPLACRPLDARHEYIKDDFGITVDHMTPNPVCMAEIGEPQCGYCTWTISDKEKYVGEAEATHLYEKPWSQIRDESILSPSEAFAAVKAWVVKMCYDNPDVAGCAEVAKWRVKLDAGDSIGDVINPTPPEPEEEFRLVPNLRL